MSNVNINSVAAVQTFFDGPSLSGVLKTVLLDDTEVQTAAVTRIVAGDREQPARIQNYVEFVVPEYSDPTFKEHFRMHRCTFQVCVLCLLWYTCICLSYSLKKEEKC